MIPTTPTPGHIALDAAYETLKRPQTRILHEPDEQGPVPHGEPVVVWYDDIPTPIVVYCNKVFFPSRLSYLQRHLGEDLIVVQTPDLPAEPPTAGMRGEPKYWLRPPIVWDESQVPLIEFPDPASRVPLYTPCPKCSDRKRYTDPTGVEWVCDCAGNGTYVHPDSPVIGPITMGRLDALLGTLGPHHRDDQSDHGA